MLKQRSLIIFSAEQQNAALPSKVASDVDNTRFHGDLDCLFLCTSHASSTQCQCQQTLNGEIATQATKSEPEGLVFHVPSAAVVVVSVRFTTQDGEVETAVLEGKNSK